MFNKIYSAKLNAVANFATSIWTTLLGLLFVPFYLRYLGIESYGLIGFFTTIQAFVSLLDFGLSPTINRELSRLSAKEENRREMLDITRTLEIPNGITTVIIAVILCLLAPLIGRFWINPKDLAVDTVIQALIIMSLSVAVQFCINFYIGGLMGLQKQVLLSLINIICGTLRSVGALLVLIWISGTIQAFLVWQGLILLLQLILVAVTLHRSLPPLSTGGTFSKQLLGNIWRFAGGMTAITVLSLILTQTDRVILSRMLSLEDFGYYSLAISIPSLALGLFASSVGHAVFPQFTKFVELQDERALRNVYHRSCQTVSVFLFSSTLILVLFSYDILHAWINQEQIAANTYVLLSIIAIGTGLNGLMWIPYFIQLAHGWTKLILYANSVAILIFVPAIIVGVTKYGAIGAAVCWLILNAGYVTIVIYFLHRRILKGEAARWYLEDLSPPFFTALLIAAIGKLIFPSNLSRYETIIALVIISAITLLLTALSTRATRDYLKLMIEKVLRFASTEKL